MSGRLPNVIVIYIGPSTAGSTWLHESPSRRHAQNRLTEAKA